MIQIVPFSQDYLTDYIDLYISTWREEPYGEDFAENEVHRQIANGDQIHLLVNDCSLIGFVGGRPLEQNCDFYQEPEELRVKTQDFFYISELTVSRDQRSLGFGNLLMQFISSAARAQGFCHFLLRTHASLANPAVPLYYKLGMSPLTRESGDVHSVSVEQKRIDDRPETDSRVYYYDRLALKSRNHELATGVTCND